MLYRTPLLVLFTGWCFAAPALAAGGTITLEDREQAACYNDVQKLCGDVVPDVDKVTACMATKRHMVSPGCAKFYDIDKQHQN